MLNSSYNWHRAWLHSRTLDEFFGMPGSSKGVICGRVSYDYSRKGKSVSTIGEDRYQPVNDIPVELCDMNGNVIQAFRLDNLNNGFYCFTNVDPGRYTVEIDEAPSSEVEVTANKTAYCNIRIITQKEPIVIEEATDNQTPVVEEEVDTNGEGEGNQ